MSNAELLTNAAAEEALLTIADPLEWICTDTKNGSRLWYAALEQCSYQVAEKIEPDTDPKRLTVWEDNRACSFLCSTVAVAKAVGGRHALTNDWDWLRQLESGSRVEAAAQEVPG